MRFIFSLLESWLAFCATRVVRRERPCIVAITGSVGKSSTKNAVGIMLGAGEPGSRVRVSEKNYNNELGVPLSILGLRPPGRSPARWIVLIALSIGYAVGWKKTGMEVMVLEMGADKPGDLAKLVAIAPPTISVITAVTPEDDGMAPVHAAHYPSVEAVALEKATLVKATIPEGT
ncbi:MAG: Mur ligase family protein, partial [bacterium]|nr:Mur ligase family protein [bacterium]